jgi:hypothetical protein
MIEEAIKNITTATAVAEYARVNGYDAAGVDNLVALWTKLQNQPAPVVTAKSDPLIE